MWMVPPYLPSNTGDLYFPLCYIIKDMLYLSCDVSYLGKCQPSFSIQSSFSCPKCAHTFYQASTRTSRSILLGFLDYVTKHLPIYDLDVPHVLVHAGTTGLLLDFLQI
jgi:hypothetical protein